MSKTLPERFWAKVNKDGPVPECRPDLGPCWLWMAAKDARWGYGSFDGGKAHRASYLLNVGPIPVGLQLDHLCRVRTCVRPSHLEPVTHGENIRRGFGWAAVNARQTSCYRGHPLSGSNLYVNTNGRRECRTCRNIRNAKYRQSERLQSIGGAA